MSTTGSTANNDGNGCLLYLLNCRSIIFDYPGSSAPLKNLMAMSDQMIKGAYLVLFAGDPCSSALFFSSGKILKWTNISKRK